MTTPVTPVPAVDLNRYLGLWYEIFRLPLKWVDGEASDITAFYTLREDGKIDVDNRCLDEERKPSQALGVARVVDDSNAKLKVNFLPALIRWLPVGDGDYWILKLDPEYRYSLVGDPERHYLWLLAREPHVPDEVRNEYLNYARLLGYNLSNLIIPNQSGNRVTDDML